MDRIARAEAKYSELFGEQASSFDTTDPEFMAILKRLIFGEVFHVGTWTMPRANSLRSPCSLLIRHCRS